jgi:alcohol dehydrogenase class IV
VLVLPRTNAFPAHSHTHNIRNRFGGDSQISIVTTPTTEKKGIVSPRLLPDWAILDPKLTLGLPAHVTAATGIDAMVHVIEAYTSRHKKNPTSDQLARQALALLSANIRTACREGGT